MSEVSPTSRKKPLCLSHLRVARPTDNIDDLLPFYCDALGFEVLGRFRDHDGFDGVMVGHQGMGYHLEFTTRCGHSAGSAPSQDHLLVFYLPDSADWKQTVDRIESLGWDPVASENPYWDKQGRTYEDPDGYRVVIQNARWPAESPTV